MATLLIIGLALVSIIALLLIIAMFINGNYDIEREVTITKPKEEVFDYVKYLKNQNKFSVWAKTDPAMKTEFTGEDATVGFVSAWDSEHPKVGKGEQKIVKIDVGERIDYEIHFIKPFEATNYAHMAFESPSKSATTVKWGFQGKMKYPMNLMMLTMNMEKMIAPDLQNGLNNLKILLEK